MFGEDSIPRFQNYRPTDLGVFDSSKMTIPFIGYNLRVVYKVLERDGHSSLGNHSGSLEKTKRGSMEVVSEIRIRNVQRPIIFLN